MGLVYQGAREWRTGSCRVCPFPEPDKFPASKNGSMVKGLCRHNRFNAPDLSESCFPSWRIPDQGIIKSRNR